MANKPTSICHMSLAEAFLTRVTQDVRTSMKHNKKVENGLGFDVVLVNMDKQTFIESYLHHLSITKQGNFTKQRSFGSKRPNLMVYDCERSCLSKGTSTGDPTKTRANGCRAYICFGFEEGATATLCVLRYRLNHVGHNPANRDEFRVNRIDCALKACIQEWVQESSLMSDILPKIAQWNKVKGHTDYKDRRFFPFPHDIQHLIWIAHKRRFSNDDEVRQIKKHEIGLPTVDNLANVLTSKYRDICTFYQPSNVTLNNAKPMILVIQTQHQQDVYRLHGEKLVFITKNFEGLRMYGNALYSLVVADNSDVAYPVAYIISNTDDPVVLIQGLHKFQQTNVEIQPGAFFIDKELVSCSEGISALYPKTKIFIPRYQIMKAVQEWLLTASTVAEKSHKDVREVLLKYILDLSKCQTHAIFLQGLKELGQKVEFPAFTEMLTNEWFPLGSMWALYGRADYFFPDDTAIVAERLFLNLEHQLLKGLQSLTKTEDLVEHIAKDLNHNKSDPEVLVNMEDFLEGTAEEQAENLLQDGWGSLVTWRSSTEVLVPSQNNMENLFHARLIPMECECPFAPYRGLCVHLHLALMLVQGKADPEEERRNAAEEAYVEGRYLVDGQSCATFHSGIMCLTSTVDSTCTCKACFFGCDCVGILLVRRLQAGILASTGVLSDDDEIIYQPPGEVVEYTVVSENSHVEDTDNLSSLTMIQRLHEWSQSLDFKDSPILLKQLREVYKCVMQTPSVNLVSSVIDSNGKIANINSGNPKDGGNEDKLTFEDSDNSPSKMPHRFNRGRYETSPYKSSLRGSPRKSSRIRTVEQNR